MATLQGHNSSVSSGLTNTVSIPGTPQAGDIMVVIAQCVYTGSGLETMAIQSDPGFTQHVAVGGDLLRRGWSKAWESGDPSSLTIEVSASFGTPSVKFQFVGAWLIRPGSGNSISFKAQGSPASTAGGSTLTSTATFNGGSPVTVSSGDIITVGHLEDGESGITYSSFDHDTFSLTIDSTFDEGSGGPSNWTGLGFASGVTNASSTTVSATNDASGNNYSMVAMAFEESTPEPILKIEDEVINMSESDIKLVESESTLPTSGSGWGIPIGIS